MPPTTVFAIAAVGIAALVFLTPGSTRLRASRSLLRVVPSEYRDPRKRYEPSAPRATC